MCCVNAAGVYPVVPCARGMASVSQSTAVQVSDEKEPQNDIMKQFASMTNPICLAELVILYGPNDADVDAQFASLEARIRERVDFLRKNRCALRKHVEDTDALSRATKRPRTSVEADGTCPETVLSPFLRARVDEAADVLSKCTLDECVAFTDYMTRALRHAMAIQAMQMGIPSNAGYV